MAARVLVVNDTQEILELFRMILEGEMGYEVILSGFPIQDVDEVAGIKPDLIILDLVFEDEKSGIQMLQILKMKRETATIPVLICTAAITSVREQEGHLVSQGVHVLYKPFDIEQLQTHVRQLLTSHEHISSTIDTKREKKEKVGD
jgi:DNA-binding response OmpR family regulator